MKTMFIMFLLLSFNVYADNKMILNKHGLISATVLWDRNELGDDVLAGDIKFKPDNAIKNCSNISFIQIAKVTNNKGQDLEWSKLSGQSQRNEMKTKNKWFVDHDATKCNKNNQCSKFFIDHWHNNCTYGSKSNDSNFIAQMKDYPFGWTEFSQIELETCAVCKDSNEVYTCIKWGASWPLIGEKKISNISIDPKPSSDFLEAVSNFDAFYNVKN